MASKIHIETLWVRGLGQASRLPELLAQVRRPHLSLFLGDIGVPTLGTRPEDPRLQIDASALCISVRLRWRLKERERQKLNTSPKTKICSGY